MRIEFKDTGDGLSLRVGDGYLWGVPQYGQRNAEEKELGQTMNKADSRLRRLLGAPEFADAARGWGLTRWGWDVGLSTQVSAVGALLAELGLIEIDGGGQ